MRYIEGEDRYQRIMFPEILDEYIREENPVRVIDAYVESVNIGEVEIGQNLSETGRPPYNPKDMLKLYIYGYFNKIRSSRRLETESGRNVEVMWLLRKLRPDHKTIANFRKENGKGLKKVFRNFVEVCKKLDLYGKELAGIDGSKFRAVNSKENNYNEEKIEERIRRIEERIEQYLNELNENDEKEKETRKHTKEEIEAAIAELSARKHNYEEMKTELEESGETQISTTDPDARRMKEANGGSDICYNVQTAVDDKNKLIIDYEVTNNGNDKNLLAPMAKSVKEILEVEEIAVVADTGFFVATDIADCISNGITAHVSSEYESVTFCVVTIEEDTNTPAEFTNQGKNVFIKDRNLGICPMGCIFYPTSYSNARKAAVYRNTKACRSCPRYKVCKEYDKVIRVSMPESHFTKKYDDSNLHFKQITYSPDKSILRKRKEIVEHPFGTIKSQMNTTSCLLKGIPKVSGEFALTFLAYNLKRVINILGVRNLLAAFSPFFPSSSLFFAFYGLHSLFRVPLLILSVAI